MRRRHRAQVTLDVRVRTTPATTPSTSVIVQPRPSRRRRTPPTDRCTARHHRGRRRHGLAAGHRHLRGRVPVVAPRRRPPSPTTSARRPPRPRRAADDDDHGAADHDAAVTTTATTAPPAPATTAATPTHGPGRSRGPRWRPRSPSPQPARPTTVRRCVAGDARRPPAPARPVVIVAGIVRRSSSAASCCWPAVAGACRVSPTRRGSAVATVSPSAGIDDGSTWVTSGAPPSSRQEVRRASDRRRRHPVGRRGQGQVHRPPRQGDGDGRPLPGRPQRRPHHRGRR